MDDLNWVGVIVVALMFGVFLLIGWLATRKAKSDNSTDLILAGRAMPLWIAVMTMTATWVDGGYILGITEFTTQGSIVSAFQPGFCYGLSLILGGLFFAHRMRRLEFATLIDPFELRYGKKWASVLFLPAMLGELFWSAALLVAISSTFNILLGLNPISSMIISASVVTLYTMGGGMWSVALTDSVQLWLIPIGLCLALPFALLQVGDLESSWSLYQQKFPEGASLFPPMQSHGSWTAGKIISWWDWTFLLVLGGVPWNCYFQRVLACKTPERARWHSIFSGVLTIVLTIPPLILGIIAATYAWDPAQAQELTEYPARALPMIFRDLVPKAVGLIGLLAILGAVTSSYSSSILSAGTMLTWNVYRPLISPQSREKTLRLVLRTAIVFLSVAAVGLSLLAEGSVYTLWTFCADLIFVLLFPQLLMAMYDPKANRIGSITAFVVSLTIRLSGGEPLFHLQPFVDYPSLFSSWLDGGKEAWYDGETMLFPYKTVAAFSGIILLPLVSRLTARWNQPVPLPNEPHGS